MKYLLIAPMTGYPDMNRELLNDMEAALESQGYEVVNPGNWPDLEWRKCLARSTHTILDDDTLGGVIVGGDWWESRGDRLEIHAAIDRQATDPPFEMLRYPCLTPMDVHAWVGGRSNCERAEE